jgi:hypothetical protein
VLTGVRFRFFRASALRVVGQAAGASFRRDSGEVRADRVSLRIEGKTPGDAVDLLAVDGFGNVDAKLAHGRGGVTLRDAQGTEGKTAAADFEGAREEAFGALPVEVVGDEFGMRAEGGFRLSLGNGGRLALLGPVAVLASEAR